ncbi:MAG: winged helix-turn-helix domain-containing protein [Archaeoglobales archaeon]|nr:winged helix-turn-helix domain-containing protein [Archaeoglobales archaeon]
MNYRRSKYEIVSEILKLSNHYEGVNITKIVYSANLNFKNAQKMISELVKSGLLEVLNGGEKKRFRTTKKGLEFIEKYDNLASVQHF